jgi:hypothetical protein
MEDARSGIFRILIGSAQGEVLSGDLLNCLTDSVRFNSPLRKVIKYSDDSFVLGKMTSISDHAEFQSLINKVCSEFSDLELTIHQDEYKEIIFDFSSNQRITDSLPASSVMGQCVKRVSSLRMLGYHLHDSMKPHGHVSKLLAKANSRLFVLYKMIAMPLPPDVLILFYLGVLRGSMEFASPAFHHALYVDDSDRMERVQKRAVKALERAGVTISLPSLADRRATLCADFLDNLIDQSCSLVPPVVEKRKGRYIQLPKIRPRPTARLLSTFIPAQIAVFNKLNTSNPEVNRQYQHFIKY